MSGLSELGKSLLKAEFAFQRGDAQLVLPFDVDDRV